MYIANTIWQAPFGGTITSRGFRRVQFVVLLAALMHPFDGLGTVSIILS